MKNNNGIERWENEGGPVMNNNNSTLNEQLAAEQKKTRSLTHCLKGIRHALTHAGDGGFFKKTITLIDDCLERNKK
jgi:hypothetical protein